MNDFNNIDKKVYRVPLSALLFLLFGICLLVLSFINLNNYSFKDKNYTLVDAKVVDHVYKNQKPVRAILEYTVNDQTYRVVSDSKADNLKSYGSTVKIKYNPDNLSEIILTTKTINILLPIASIISIGLAVIILIVSLISNLSRRDNKRLTDTMFDLDVPKYKNESIENDISNNNDYNYNNFPIYDNMSINKDTGDSTEVVNTGDTTDNNFFNHKITPLEVSDNVVSNTNNYEEPEYENTSENSNDYDLFDKDLDYSVSDNDSIDYNINNTENIIIPTPYEEEKSTSTEEYRGITYDNYLKDSDSDLDYIDYISSLDSNDIVSFIPNINEVKSKIKQ